MGYFQNFPYMRQDALNIDWVFEVCLKMDDALKNLNHTIESVIRPIIGEQQQFIKQYYNQLLIDLNRISNDMDTRVSRMERKVNKQLYDNVQQMAALNREVREELRAAQERNELTVTKYKQEVDRLLAFYNASFKNMIAQADANMSDTLRTYEHIFDTMIADNKAEMRVLERAVKNEIENNHILINQTVIKLEQQMSDLKMDININLTDTLSQVRQIENMLILEMARIDEQNSNYYKNVTTLFNDVKSMLELKIDFKADKSFVDDQISRLEQMINDIQVDMTIVINPVTGEWSTVQQALNDLYDNNRPWALTAQEYDDLQLRAYEYDDIVQSGMTAYNYDYLARWFLIYKFAMISECKNYTDAQIAVIDRKFTDITNSIISISDERWAYIQKCCNDVNKQINELMYMYSPFDGKFRPIKIILQQMFEHLYGEQTLTAQEYDNLALTAIDYDNKNITAYDYDWYGKNILGGA